MCRSARDTEPQLQATTRRKNSAVSDDTLIGRRSSEGTLVDKHNMVEVNESTELERKRSYGIGGAGNIRTLLRKYKALVVESAFLIRR